jgi:hypothetical protein
MNLEAEGEGMGMLYRIVLGDAYYRAPDVYTVADNTGGDSSSTADENKRTYQQGYDYGLSIRKPDTQEIEDFEQMLNNALTNGAVTEDYARGAREGLAGSKSVCDFCSSNCHTGSGVQRRYCRR